MRGYHTVKFTCRYSPVHVLDLSLQRFQPSIDPASTFAFPNFAAQHTYPAVRLQVLALQSLLVLLVFILEDARLIAIVQLQPAVEPAIDQYCVRIAASS